MLYYIYGNGHYYIQDKEILVNISYIDDIKLSILNYFGSLLKLSIFRRNIQFYFCQDFSTRLIIKNIVSFIYSCIFQKIFCQSVLRLSLSFFIQHLIQIYQYLSIQMFKPPIVKFSYCCLIV